MNHSRALTHATMSNDSIKLPVKHRYVSGIEKKTSSKIMLFYNNITSSIAPTAICISDKCPSIVPTEGNDR